MRGAQNISLWTVGPGTTMILHILDEFCFVSLGHWIDVFAVKNVLLSGLFDKTVRYRNDFLCK